MPNIINENLNKKQEDDFQNTIKMGKKTITSRQLHLKVKSLNRQRLITIVQNQNQKIVQKNVSQNSNQNCDKYEQQIHNTNIKKDLSIIIQILKAVLQKLSIVKNKSNDYFMSQSFKQIEKNSTLQFYNQKRHHLHSLMTMIPYERLKQIEFQIQFQRLNNGSEKQKQHQTLKKCANLRKLDNFEVKIQKKLDKNKKQQLIGFNQDIYKLYLVDCLLSELSILCYVSQFIKNQKQREKIFLTLQKQFLKYSQNKNKCLLLLDKNQESNSYFYQHKNKQKSEKFNKLAQFTKLKSCLLQYLIFQKCLKVQKFAYKVKSTSVCHFNQLQNQDIFKKQQENLQDNNQLIQEYELQSKQEPIKMQYSAKRLIVLFKKNIKLLSQIIRQYEGQRQKLKNEMFSSLQQKDLEKQETQEFKKLNFKINIQILHEIANIIGIVPVNKKYLIKQKKQLETNKIKQLKTIYNLDPDQNPFRKSVSTLTSSSLSLHSNNINHKNIKIIQKIYQVLYYASLKQLGQNELLTLTMKNIWQKKISLKKVLQEKNKPKNIKTSYPLAQKRKQKFKRSKTSQQQDNTLD